MFESELEKFIMDESDPYLNTIQIVVFDPNTASRTKCAHHIQYSNVIKAVLGISYNTFNDYFGNAGKFLISKNSF